MFGLDQSRPTINVGLDCSLLNMFGLDKLFGFTINMFGLDKLFGLDCSLLLNTLRGGPGRRGPHYKLRYPYSALVL